MIQGALWGIEAWRGFHTIRLGCVLQRLFSTFPNSWPGFGLLLLRVGVGTALIYLGTSSLFGTPGTPITIARDLIEAAGGVFLLAGLWTPVAGALVALDELWIGLTLYPSQQDGRWHHIFLVVLTASVAMLGPGAWSIDARLFGRKLFRTADRTRRKKPSL
jgi:putative oxidoreductase